VTSLAVSLAFLSFHTINYAKINSYIKEYAASDELIDENSTVLPLCFYNPKSKRNEQIPSYRVNPFLHLAGHLTLGKALVELDNYQAWCGSFPVQYRSYLNPLKYLALQQRMETVPPEVDILSYPHKTGGTVDYVLLWNLGENYANCPQTKAILNQLEIGYLLIYETPHLKLYRLNSLPDRKNELKYFSQKYNFW
jgi:hypothetical protein